jgi:hypothetical protein
VLNLNAAAGKRSSNGKAGFPVTWYIAKSVPTSFQRPVPFADFLCLMPQKAPERGSFSGTVPYSGFCLKFQAAPGIFRGFVGGLG